MSQVIIPTSVDEIWAAAVVLPILGILTVGARFYTRIIQHSKLGADDWLMLPALASLITMGVLLIVGLTNHVVGYPTPKPQYATPLQADSEIIPAVVLISKLQYGFQLVAIFMLGLVKLSVIFFCRRIFVVQQTSTFSIISAAFILGITSWMLYFFISFADSCSGHVSAEWSPNVIELRYCPNGERDELNFAISDFVTDVFVIGLPMPIIWRLHAKSARKLSITLVFLLGFIAVAASATRLGIYIKLITPGTNLELIDRDLLVSEGLYWTMLECGLAIIAACMPTLRFLVGTVAADNILRSIRSFISLRSQNSEISHFEENQSGSTKQPFIDAPGLFLTSTTATRVSAERLGLGSVSSVVNQEGKLPTEPEQIHVRKEISQLNSAV